MKKLIFVLVLLILTGCKDVNVVDVGSGDKNKNEIENNISFLEQVTNEYDYTTSINIFKSYNKIIEVGVMNPLTGFMMEEEFENKRPTAVVFNNLKAALPQSGIAQSDIFYEVLAEGGITRVIGVSHNFTADKIGPIRSTRDYFLKFALDNDAIFVHHGGSPQGYEYIQNNKINNLDGMILEGSLFFRDKERARQRGLEHSSYTSGENIETGKKNYGYNTEYSQGFIPALNFYEENYLISNEESHAIEIRLPYSYLQLSRFEYNEEEEIYYRFQGDEKHMDENTDEQLTVKNVLVQYANSSVIDDVGRMAIKLNGTGWGYYFTNGRYELVTWKKDGDSSPTKWYHEDGNQLSINKGKTWISIFSSNDKIEIVKEKSSTENSVE